MSTNNDMCVVCVEKRKNPFKLRPLSLEYLALKATLQNCIQKKTIEKYLFLTRELCQQKWYRWCFLLRNKNLVFHANDIIAITTESNNDNRRIFFEQELLKSYCIICHTHECVICRYRKSFIKYGRRSLNTEGHFCSCEEKY